MEHIDLVERLMEKANVSYGEAKQALENNNWDILDALIDLERQGKVRSGEGTTHYTTDRESEPASPHTEASGGDNKRRSGWEAFWESFCELIRKGMANHFVVERRGETLISIPVLIMLLLVCVCFWLALPLLIVGLFCECHYSFQGSELGRKDVNDAMGKVSGYAEDIKDSVKAGMNENRRR